MRKVVLDTNCLLMSIPKISPYRRIWDDFLGGKIVLCVTDNRGVFRNSVSKDNSYYCQ